MGQKKGGNKKKKAQPKTETTPTNEVNTLTRSMMRTKLSGGKETAQDQNPELQPETINNKPMPKIPPQGKGRTNKTAPNTVPVLNNPEEKPQTDLNRDNNEKEKNDNKAGKQTTDTSKHFLSSSSSKTPIPQQEEVPNTVKTAPANIWEAGTVEPPLDEDFSYHTESEQLIIANEFIEHWSGTSAQIE